GGILGLVARAGGSWSNVSVVGQAECGCSYTVADVAVDGAGGLAVAWRRASRRAADVAAITARRAGGGPWRSVAMRPVPDAGGVDLAADGGPGAAAIWSAGSAVRAMMRRGPA